MFGNQSLEAAIVRNLPLLTDVMFNEDFNLNLIAIYSGHLC